MGRQKFRTASPPGGFRSGATPAIEAIRSLRRYIPDDRGADRNWKTGTERKITKNRWHCSNVARPAAGTLGPSNSPIWPECSRSNPMPRLMADAAPRSRGCRRLASAFFHSNGPGCYRCHQVEGRGGRELVPTFVLDPGMDRRRLVQSILAAEPRNRRPSSLPGRSPVPTEPFSPAWSIGESVDGRFSFADSTARRDHGSPFGNRRHEDLKPLPSCPTT